MVQHPKTIQDMFFKYLSKSLDTAVSLKFLLVMLSTGLVVKQHIDAQTWMTVVLSITGMRTINEAMTIMKSGAPAAVKPKEEP